MKKLILTLATVAFLGGFLGQSSAAKADVSISATFPLGGGGVSFVSAPPIVYEPVVRAPVLVDYRHDDWRYRHDHYWRDHHDRRYFDNRYDHRY